MTDFGNETCPVCMCGAGLNPDGSCPQGCRPNPQRPQQQSSPTMAEQCLRFVNQIANATEVVVIRTEYDDPMAVGSVATTYKDTALFALAGRFMRYVYAHHPQVVTDFVAQQLDSAAIAAAERRHGIRVPPNAEGPLL